MKIGGMVALILGLAVWVGEFRAVVPVHMALGTVLVLCMWVLAIIAYRKMHESVPLLVSGIWGLLTVGVGMSQSRFSGMPDLIIHTLHVVLGLGVIWIGAVSSRTVRRPEVLPITWIS